MTGSHQRLHARMRVAFSSTHGPQLQSFWSPERDLISPGMSTYIQRGQLLSCECDSLPSSPLEASFQVTVAAHGGTRASRLLRQWLFSAQLHTSFPSLFYNVRAEQSPAPGDNGVWEVGGINSTLLEFPEEMEFLLQPGRKAPHFFHSVPRLGRAERWQVRGRN